MNIIILWSAPTFQMRKKYHYLVEFIKNHSTFKFIEPINVGNLETLKSLSRFITKSNIGFFFYFFYTTLACVLFLYFVTVTCKHVQHILIKPVSIVPMIWCSEWIRNWIELKNITAINEYGRGKEGEMGSYDIIEWNVFI